MMRNVAILDARESFLADIYTRIMVEEVAEFELVATSTKPEDISTIINRMKPDEIVVSENLLGLQTDWDYSVPVTTFAQTEAGVKLATNKNLKTYGVVTRPGDLIEAINKMSYKVIEGVKKPAQMSQPKVQTMQKQEYVQPQDVPVNKPVVPKETTKPQTQRMSGAGLPVLDMEEEYYFEEQPNQKAAEYQVEKPVEQEHHITFEQPHTYKESTKESKDYSVTYATPPSPEARNEYRNPSQERFQRAAQENNQSAIQRMVENDLRPGNRKKKTHVSTFYSAKGGVGKTTLSSETAVYLALMSNGRTNNRVCIVDYNVDFGDVLTTLYLREDGKNMMFWADDIKERMASGEKPENITYTRPEIEYYLQKMDCGLYALVAPLTHEDSMDLTEDQLSVMLKNLINNGEFDYIICDTGNNTRDSSFLALDNSDTVFLVVTQDVTTANCDLSFLQTMKQIGFDLDKIRLIINDVRPYKETGISVKELETKFSEFPCIARIKHNTDVVKANNLGEPLTLNPAHEYTRELKGIVQYITGVVPESVTKESIFSKIFKRK